ncbi:MAG: EAL domain-containing response regulator, partial [Gemmatimonadaceae bacterium]|nr:EAL domain-containing response regulator [Gemmatimonadaceae bacterium]
MTEILLIDDDPLQLKLLARTLNGLGYTSLLGCSSAAAALSALNAPNRDIGLILLDLNMPGVDGVAFLKLLAERRAEIPVVLVSGEDERLVETAARFAAAQDIKVIGTLPKPVWPAELRAVLERWNEPASAPPSLKRYAAEDVARAILHNELVAHFQPIVNLQTGALVGAETLVRWQHPADGLVLPGQFVEVAEERGLIRDITRQMLSAAMALGKKWHGQGLDAFVAVNVTMADLTRPELADFVFSELERSGLVPKDLVDAAPVGAL